MVQGRALIIMYLIVFGLSSDNQKLMIFLIIWKVLMQIFCAIFCIDSMVTYVCASPQANLGLCI